MMVRTIGFGIGIAMALGLAGCAPGPGGYAGWSHMRQQQANEHAYRANQAAAQADWQARHGDYYGAQQSRAAANDQAAQAQAAHDHAQRDRFLSQF